MNKTVAQALLYAAVLALGAVVSYNIVHIPKQSEMVILFVLLLLYPIFRFPLAGVYVVFILSPFVPFIRRLYYLVHGRPETDPLIMVTDILIAVVFLGLFFEFRNRLRQNAENGFYLKLVLFYLAYLVFRTFVLNESPPAEAAARLKFYAPSVLLFYIGYVYAHRRDHLRRLVWITALLAIAAGVYGLKQLYFGYSSAEKVWFSSISFTTLFIKGIARPFSFLQSPASFADYEIVGLIAVLSLASTGKARTKFLLAAAVPILCCGILVTSVRSSWIGAVAVLFFWFAFFRFSRPTHRLAAVAAAVVVFFSCQFVAESLAGNFDFARAFGTGGGGKDYLDMLVTARTGAITNPFEEYSLLSRIALWQMIAATSVSLPMAVFGRGLGVLNADSLYFTYLAEFGYPGLILVLVLVIGFLSHGTRAMALMNDGRAIALVKAILVFDAVFALMNITGSHIHSFPGDAYFWFFNGVLMNARALETGGEGKDLAV
jgi:hypothetical protein